ncbi:MAG: winged helix-turn-helix domain-containing protein [Acidobacteria bacterium]|nr:winged helix-turn-helix domain-containing protein [Acidobacteriota bacterium]
MTSYRFGQFRLVPDQRLLERAGMPIALTPRALDLLVMLVRHRARVITKDEMLAVVWPGREVEEGNIAQQIHLLRRALADAGECVVTVPKHGYRFAAEVTECSESPRHAGITQHALLWDGRAFLLPEGSTVVGRADDVDVQLLLPSVSRRHAQIDVRGLDATVRDLESTHGTWRGVTRVQGAVPLVSGDEVRLGSALLVYRFTRPDDTTV